MSLQSIGPKNLRPPQRRSGVASSQEWGLSAKHRCDALTLGSASHFWKVSIPRSPIWIVVWTCFIYVIYTIYSSRYIPAGFSHEPCDFATLPWDMVVNGFSHNLELQITRYVFVGLGFESSFSLYRTFRWAGQIQYGSRQPFKNFNIGDIESGWWWLEPWNFMTFIWENMGKYGTSMGNLWNHGMDYDFPIILGMSSSQLTNFIIFQRGRYTCWNHQAVFFFGDYFCSYVLPICF